MYAIGARRRLVIDAILLAAVVGSIWFLPGAALSVGHFYRIDSMSPLAEPPPIPSVTLSLDRSETETHITVRSTSEVDSRLEPLLFVVPDLGIERRLTPKELQSGMTLPLKDRPGSYRASLLWKGNEIFSGRLAVPMHVTLSADLPSFKLAVGKVEFRRPEWMLPIRVEAWNKTPEGDELPSLLPTAREVVLSVVGGGVDPKEYSASFTANSATTMWISVPLSPKEPTTVRATEKSSGAFIASGVFQWGDHAPVISLQVFPSYSRAVAIPGREATLWLFYEQSGVRVPLAQDTEVSIALDGDSSAVLASPSTVALGPTHEQAEVRIAASGLGGGTLVHARDPLTGKQTTAMIQLLFPWLLVGTATAAGVVGVVVAMVLHKESLSVAVVLGRLVCGAAGGLVAFLLFILQWLPYPGRGDPSSVVTAILVGMLGGYGGTAVFDIALGIMNALRRPQAAPQPSGPKAS
jgi:hypothetical protein